MWLLMSPVASLVQVGNHGRALLLFIFTYVAVQGKAILFNF